MRALLRLVIGAQLVAGVALVVTLDPDETSVGTLPPTSTTAPAATTASSAAPATTAKPPPARPSTTTTTPPPTLKPAGPGSYDYRLRTTDSDGQTRDFTGSRAFFTAKEQDGELRQVVFEGDDRNGTTRSSHAWRADGLYLRSFSVSDSDGDYDCNVEPDLLLYPSPLTVGRQWRSAGSCHDQGSPLTFEGTFRVLRTERLTVANRQVAVQVIEFRGPAAHIGPNGDVHVVDYFSLDLGISVREDTTYRWGPPDNRGESRESFELLTLDPKPLDKTPQG